MNLSQTRICPEGIYEIGNYFCFYCQVTSVDGRQENLAMATDNAVRRADQLCTSVKNSALTIGANPGMLGFSEMNDECISSQTLLLNAVRDVAVSLVEFFNCTKMNVTTSADKERDR